MEDHTCFLSDRWQTWGFQMVLLTLMGLWGWGLEKILHCHQLYIDRPDPITFISLPVDTSDHIYDDFLRLLFLHVHREVSALPNDIPEESRHFCFLHTACLSNIKGSVGLILAKASTMRISIPLDLSSRPFIPPSRFIHSRWSTTLLAPSLIFSPLCSV